MSTQPTQGVDPNSPLGLVSYYCNLLILQYLGKPKAYSTIFTTVAPFLMPQTSVQAIVFSDVAASGAFTLSYNGNATASMNWNDSVGTIQTRLRAVSGLSSVTVSGSIASQSLSVTFTGVTPPAQLLVLSSNTLQNVSSIGIQVTLSESDQTLPLAVLNGFNIQPSLGPTALGVQLDILGEYCGVTRSGNGALGTLTLDDADFLILIQFAIVQNHSGSSLSDIERNLNQFFPGQFIVTDYQNMFMSYIFSSSLGSENLFLLLVAENLIPHPMGVGISVITPPDVNQYFGFSTYNGINLKVKPFNTYSNFNTSWFFLSYDDAL